MSIISRAPVRAARTLAALAVGTLFTSAAILGQGSASDYERAAALRQRSEGKVVDLRVRARWLSDGKRFWYRRDLPGGLREYVAVDAAAKRREPAFDHSRLAAALANASGKEVDGDRLDIDALEWDEKTVHLNALGKGWSVSRENYSVQERARLESPPEPPRRRRRWRGRDGRAAADSPDGKWSAFIKEHNVYVRQRGDEGEGDAFALTTNGKPEHPYDDRFYWSPDSKRLVATRTAKEENHTIHFVESSPKDQVQPKLHSRQYLKPGDRVASTKPHLFDLTQRAEIPVADDLFSNPWSLRNIRWQPDSRRFTFVYNQRGHQVLRVVGVDAETGESGAIIDEQSRTFIDYAHKQFYYPLDETHEILWMSERDGWNHLYRIDSRSGAVKNQITKGPWVVRGVDHDDAKKRQIWFRAGGIYPEQDPYFIHHCRVSFDGSDLVVLTAANGTHEVAFSPDRRYLIARHSRVDRAPVVELRSGEDGRELLELERADIEPLLATGWQRPERFAAKGRDGATDIYGIILRPTTFDPEKEYPEKKYPVIELIYAGPHGSHVPKSFRSHYRALTIAELGFIVVQIDGMGTSHRSKAFHDVCWKNLKDAGFPDRILWMQAAARKYPYLDLTRVGIYGGSAGGQNTVAALLHYPDFYKAGVSDCGCHDNRMDKIWWNELWMGWPIGPEYADNSNVTHADKLKGKLLLTVGELDTNVDPASTMQVVNALIQADKDFELLVLPGRGHGAGESTYGRRRRQDFFVRHLLGVEPRWTAADKDAADVASGGDDD